MLVPAIQRTLRASPTHLTREPNCERLKTGRAPHPASRIAQIPLRMLGWRAPGSAPLRKRGVLPQQSSYNVLRHTALVGTTVPLSLQDNPYFGQQKGKARWTLSEEEDKRGAGLWVWGLFKDPLYPFLLLQVDNLEIVSVRVVHPTLLL